MHRSFVLVVESAREEDSQVSLADLCHFKIFIRGTELSNLALVILLVDKHEEDLEYEPLILIATRHLYHEQEDAEVVEVEPLHDLLLCEVYLGYPLINFPLHGRLVDLVIPRVLYNCRRLTDFLQSRLRLVTVKVRAEVIGIWLLGMIW